MSTGLTTRDSEAEAAAGAQPSAAAPASAAVSASSSPAAVFEGRPRQRARGLAHTLVDDLGDKIRGHQLKPGDKLPPESAIMQAYGVSRTVVREALSRLQAAGLVETHHGVGTFVLTPRTAGMFRLDASELPVAVDVLAVLELRISLETECAGLAANRRSETELAGLRAALDEFARNVESASDTVTPDFQFHLQIAQSTGNPYFAEIMRYLGTTIIPRTRVNAVRQERRGEYLLGVNREHEEIYAAIARRDAEAARAAMRLHLTNSRERLRVAQQEAHRAQPSG